MAAQITRKVMQLKFGKTNGKELNLTVNDPREDIEPEEVSAQMDALIAAGCFGDAGLAINSKVGAAYIIQSSDAIQI